MTFHIYGFMIALGILAGLLLADKLKIGLLGKKLANKLDVFSAAWWVLLPGVAGARLYHVLNYWSFYSQDIAKIFFVWEGGLGIFGGIAGGMLGLLLYSMCFASGKKAVFVYLKFLDLSVLGLSIGQAIGRWGNYFNQELYGLPTDLPWGIYIKPENRLPGMENFSRFHPLFLYESLWDFLILVFLVFLSKLYKQRRSGLLFAVYLLAYSFGRFFLEYLRIGPWRAGCLTMGQWWSMVIFSAGALFCLKIIICELANKKGKL